MASVSDRKKRDVSGVFGTVAAMMGCLDAMVDDEFERGMVGLLSLLALTPNRLRNLRIRIHPAAEDGGCHSLGPTVSRVGIGRAGASANKCG